jgi:hypothetical protein
VPNPPVLVTPVLVPPESVAPHLGVTTVMSSVTREGEWVMPRSLRAVTVMGEATIDLTQVRIAPGTSEIDARAIMGEIKIIIPHNLRVECTGQPMLGSFKVTRSAIAVPVPDAPLVRITGVACMGNVVVKVVDPNERRWVNRLRRRGLLGPGG